ncbi:hypothetical protein [Thiobacillus sp.]|uniref:hypothetical protein n=1 Tax=Thiobacillus sp. TaxID=924 RepID=UPI0011D83D4C|nr:hypothetical protein [Thiobacillus sp.]TXH74951.1 MAG: hypothetical protein E6Q82_08155 [Thiobacillus sp.]
MTEQNFEIRTFGSFSEIQALPGFVLDNPITKDNYARLLGDYSLADEVHCCFQKENGNLCNEGHKWGFVAALKDNSVTIVGNNCAISKFGADSTLKSDISRYINEKKRQERLDVLTQLISEKQNRLSALHITLENLKELRKRIGLFKARLGDQTRRRLEDMAKTGKTAVEIIGVNYRDYIDDDGNSNREKHSISSNLGHIFGIGWLNETNHHPLFVAIQNVKLAYEEAEQVTLDIKLSELDELTRKINDSSRIVGEVDSFLEQEEAFLKSNFALLCFLTPDKTERYKAARFVLEEQGLSSGKDKAKDWLVNYEREIREELKIEKIEIP